MCTKTTRRSLLAAAALAAVATTAAAGPASAHARHSLTKDVAVTPGNVRITGSDFAFAGPARIAPGLTTITFTASGKGPHQLQLAKLNKGVTLAQAMAAAKDPNPGALLSLVTVAGGVTALQPGATQQAIVDLTTGTYLELSFAAGPDHVPDIAKGMVGSFTVAGSRRTAGATPKATHTATLGDFTIAMPKALPKRSTLAVRNTGKQPHEIALYRIADGKTMADVMASQQRGGPAPMAEAGGLGAIAPGQRGYVTLDLRPGNYLALCAVPDPASHKAHVELGMLAEFTVV